MYPLYWYCRLRPLVVFRATTTFVKAGIYLKNIGIEVKITASQVTGNNVPHTTERLLVFGPFDLGADQRLSQKKARDFHVRWRNSSSRMRPAPFWLKRATQHLQDGVSEYI